MNLLERPSSGEVRIAGTDLMQLSDEQLRQARHQIGMIFQGFNLVNNHTVEKNVELSLKFSGVKNARSESTRLNSSHVAISYAVFCLKKKITFITSLSSVHS